MITGNQLNVAGDGIQCSADGAWIENNKVVRSDAAAKGRIGIGLVPGLGPLGTSRCQILANQVSGFAQAGIEVSAPARDLIIKLNVIEHCGNGIISTAKANASSLSIENNHLRNIGSDGNPGSEVLGIFRGSRRYRCHQRQLDSGAGRPVAGSATPAAILTIGVRRSSVSGNDISDVAQFEETGVSAGIMFLAPYAQFSVNYNRVERDAFPASQPLTGKWFALVAAANASPDTGVTHTSAFATIAVEREPSCWALAALPSRILPAQVESLSPRAVRCWATC